MSEIENILGIIVADKEGIIKSVSCTNGGLPSSLIGTKWYDAFSIPIEEAHIVEGKNPAIIGLCESEKKLSILSSYDKEGNISGFHILVEKKCEEKNYIQFMNKVSCLGKIAPEIAHEINNPLAYVSGWLQMFLAETQDTDPKKKTFETLIGEFERIANLTNSLLDFAKQTARPKNVFDVNQVIEDVITMIGYAMKNENVEIRGDFTSSEIVVHGESNRLKQVVLNVMQNARESMRDGGIMYIVTNVVQDDLVQIQFSDTGCGMSKDQLTKAFLPTFTTRADDRGSGLGLSVCKNIIEEFGGSVSLKSNVGEGTVVSINLPKHSTEQDGYF
ncbi:MAG: HAMP domain-containing histidine kinase [Candidatus Scalindua sp.]|nr:HAMP domain-containing histidine kinase [Candidatus Scalindua sp.]